MALIKVEKLSKKFKEDDKTLLALKDINLEIAEGEFFVILGPSGSGKSTLLRILSHLDKDFQGQLTYDDSVKISDFSFIFQSFALLPWMTVLENVEFGLLSDKISPEERRARAIAELTKLGLEKFVNAYPKELSGGMKQRIGIARALVKKPKVIFMDEPFSALDSFTAEELRQEVLSIWKDTQTTFIMVTHLIPEAIELADKIAVLSSRPGEIIEVIDNKLDRPRIKRSEEFYKMEDRINQIIKNSSEIVNR